MAFFLAFLVLTAIILPAITLSQAGPAAALDVRSYVDLRSVRHDLSRTCHGLSGDGRNRRVPADWICVVSCVSATGTKGPGSPSRQAGHWIYFSFVTLTTAGCGDVQPLHPVARSLAAAEALVGQLCLALVIASLVRMALQTRWGPRPE
jgi:hypothetical protein